MPPRGAGGNQEGTGRPWGISGASSGAGRMLLGRGRPRFAAPRDLWRLLRGPKPLIFGSKALPRSSRPVPKRANRSRLKLMLLGMRHIVTLRCTNRAIRFSSGPSFNEFCILAVPSSPRHSFSSDGTPHAFRKRRTSPTRFYLPTDRTHATNVPESSPGSAAEAAGLWSVPLLRTVLGLERERCFRD